MNGAAAGAVGKLKLPAEAAVCPGDLRGFQPRVLVKEGDAVKIGTPVLEDKDIPEIKMVSPVSGRIGTVRRGERRLLLAVTVVPDGKQDAVALRKWDRGQAVTMDRAAVIAQLQAAGVWPFLRQRPFSRIADPRVTPKAIFVRAMATDPLALDPALALEGREKDFWTGVEILTRLTKGPVHVCRAASSTAAVFRSPANIKNVQIHTFSGPHPAGNISTHIHHIDPIRKGETVWYLNAEDVLRVTAAMVEGRFLPERVVAVAGEGAASRGIRRTVVGASMASLTGTAGAEVRVISGSVLNGREDGDNGFLGCYDTQVTVLPRGGRRELMGWMDPGVNRVSFSRAFLSALRPSGPVSLDTDRHGDFRAIVLNHIYDDYVPLDLMTFFLLKAALAGDIEEMERLGILECDEEDFALCTFACPSKTDVGGIIRQGLDLIEREG